MISEIKGLNFPIRFSSSGNLSRANGSDKLLANMKNIILTRLRERVMRPSFGLSLADEILKKHSTISHTMIKREIKEAITLYESRVVLHDVEVIFDEDTSTLRVTLRYTPKALGYQTTTDVTFGVEQ